LCVFSVVKDKAAIIESSETLNEVVSMVEHEKQSLTEIKKDLSEIKIELGK
jgi:uncharacterized membrane protein YjjP (DUF1212 family)